MKQRIFLIAAWLCLLALSTACSFTGEDATTATDAPEPTAPTDDVDLTEGSEPELEPSSSAEECPEPTTGTHRLTYAATGICFLYPDFYDVFQAEGESGVTLYRRSLLNTEAPLASIDFEPANGRSLEEVTAQRLDDYAFPDTEAQPLTLGGVPASLLDNLPGQDINRRVVAVHDGAVYDLTVARIGPDYGEVGEQAEALYDILTGSFQFIDVEPDAPLLAGPECPEPEAGTTLYTNRDDGYCLLLPDGYMVDDSPAAEDGGGETAIYVGSPQDATHARLFIQVIDAGGQELNELTLALESEIEAAVPGYDAIWSFGYMLDGEFANQFDQLPGQDLSRRVLLLRDGRLYKYRL